MTARRLRIRWRVTPVVESLDRLLDDLGDGGADELRRAMREGQELVEAALAQLGELGARLAACEGAQSATLDEPALEALRGAAAGEFVLDLPALVAADPVSGPARVCELLDGLARFAWAVEAERLLGRELVDRDAVQRALERWVKDTHEQAAARAAGEVGDDDEDDPPISVVELLAGLPRDEAVHVARKLGLSSAGSREVIARRAAKDLAAAGLSPTQAVEHVVGLLRKSGLVAFLADSEWETDDAAFTVVGKWILRKERLATLEKLARRLVLGQVHVASEEADLECLFVWEEEESDDDDFEDAFDGDDDAEDVDDFEESEDDTDGGSAAGFGGLGDDPPPPPPPDERFDGGSVGLRDVEWFCRLAGVDRISNLAQLTTAWRTVAKKTHPDRKCPSASAPAFCRAQAVHQHLHACLAA